MQTYLQQVHWSAAALRSDFPCTPSESPVAYKAPTVEVLKDLKKVSQLFLNLSTSKAGTLFDFITASEKIDIDYEMKMTGNFTIETLTTLIAKFSNYFNNAEKKIDRVIQLLSNTLEKL